VTTAANGLVSDGATAPQILAAASAGCTAQL
jgi:hypothetical protein